MGQGLSIAALILGIMSLFASWLPGFGLIFVIATLTISFLALKQKSKGKGMAIAGLVMGFLALIPAIITALGILGMVAFFKGAE